MVNVWVNISYMDGMVRFTAFFPAQRCVPFHAQSPCISLHHCHAFPVGGFGPFEDL